MLILWILNFLLWNWILQGILVGVSQDIHRLRFWSNAFDRKKLSIREWIIFKIRVFIGRIVQSGEDLLIILFLISFWLICRYWWLAFSIWGWIYTESKLSLLNYSLLTSSLITFLPLRWSCRRTELIAKNFDFGVWICSLQYTCLLFVFRATSFSLFLQQFLLPLESLSWWTHILSLVFTIRYIWFSWLLTTNRWRTCPKINSISCRANTS